MIPQPHSPQSNHCPDSDICVSKIIQTMHCYKLQVNGSYHNKKRQILFMSYKKHDIYAAGTYKT